MTPVTLGSEDGWESLAEKPQSPGGKQMSCTVSLIARCKRHDILSRNRGNRVVRW